MGIKLLQQIFSVKNSVDKSHKIICLFGIKIKIRKIKFFIMISEEFLSFIYGRIYNLPKINKKYNQIFSLGLDCAMAGLLQDFNKRKFSGPFDWIDGSDLKTRSQLIKNRFENFINKGDLERIFIENDSDKKTKRYKNKRTNLNFHHDWDITQDFDEHYEFVKEKYDRRIKRLLNFIDKDNKIAFFILDRKGVITKSDLVDIFSDFSDNLDFICISHKEEISEKDIVFKLYNDNIHHYFINNKPTDLSCRWQEFKGNKVIVKAILSRYKLIKAKGNE